jgi:hypothetical protein
MKLLGSKLPPRKFKKGDTVCWWCHREYVGWVKTHKQGKVHVVLTRVPTPCDLSIGHVVDHVGESFWVKV